MESSISVLLFTHAVSEVTTALELIVPWAVLHTMSEELAVALNPTVPAGFWPAGMKARMTHRMAVTLAAADGSVATNVAPPSVDQSFKHWVLHVALPATYVISDGRISVITTLFSKAGSPIGAPPVLPYSIVYVSVVPGVVAVGVTDLLTKNLPADSLTPIVSVIAPMSALNLCPLPEAAC